MDFFGLVLCCCCSSSCSSSSSSGWGLMVKGPGNRWTLRLCACFLLESSHQRPRQSLDLVALGLFLCIFFFFSRDLLPCFQRWLPCFQGRRSWNTRQRRGLRQNFEIWSISENILKSRPLEHAWKQGRKKNSDGQRSTENRKRRTTNSLSFSTVDRWPSPHFFLFSLVYTGAHRSGTLKNFGNVHEFEILLKSPVLPWI